MIWLIGNVNYAWPEISVFQIILNVYVCWYLHDKSTYNRVDSLPVCKLQKYTSHAVIKYMDKFAHFYKWILTISPFV